MRILLPLDDGPRGAVDEGSDTKVLFVFCHILWGFPGGSESDFLIKRNRTGAPTRTAYLKRTQEKWMEEQNEGRGLVLTRNCSRDLIDWLVPRGEKNRILEKNGAFLCLRNPIWMETEKVASLAVLFSVFRVDSKCIRVNFLNSSLLRRPLCQRIRMYFPKPPTPTV